MGGKPRIQHGVCERCGKTVLRAPGNVHTCRDIQLGSAELESLRCEAQLELLHAAVAYTDGGAGSDCARLCEAAQEFTASLSTRRRRDAD